MIGGFYGAGKNALPSVVHIAIARFEPKLPKAGESLKFLVSIHVEGTGVTWQRNVTLEVEKEKRLLELTQKLYLWSVNAKFTRETSRGAARELGRLLYDTFIGRRGRLLLESFQPSAILLNVDETIQNLPWELMGPGGEPLSLAIPFGRLVTTREILKSGRDPLQEDSTLKILAVADTTGDLSSAAGELAVLKALHGQGMGFTIKVDVLEGQGATLSEFRRRVAPGDYDIIHFSGHGAFVPKTPAGSGLQFVDGILQAKDILALEWKAPPYFVFSSACESGRAGGGRRLVSRGRNSNGVAAAFIASGVSGYAGYFWPVSDSAAQMFCGSFYHALFELANVGLAFCQARGEVARAYEAVGDLAAISAILYGDAASSQRRDLYLSI